MPHNSKITKTIRQKSADLGFAACGFVSVSHLEDEETHLRTWTNLEYHGRMEYLSREPGKRANPERVMEGAKTIILLLQNYFTPDRQTDPEAPILSRYAYGKDYHGVIRVKLHCLLSAIQEMLPGTKGYIFNDTAPVLEKAWASRAGLGWIGKNSLLISPEHGSFCFIGGILLDQELGDSGGILPDQKLGDSGGKIPADLCGSCTLCLDACPTRALVAPRVLDARRCISYQTVELKDCPDPALSGRFQNRVYGCDICQEVCPWNRKAKCHKEEAFLISPELKALTSEEWYRMEHALFLKLFADSPVRRIGFEKLKRNLEFLKIK